MQTRPPHRLARAAEVAAAVALAVALLAFGLPRTARTGWRDIGQVLGDVPLTALLALTALWLLGLSAHTIALSAALPGLSHRRAFFLNMTGSCVSNLLPLGGTAGTLVNFWSARTWGFGLWPFVRWALVTNIWDVLSRLAVPGLALAWLSAAGPGDTQGLAGATVGAGLALLAVVALTVVLLRGDAGARRVGRAADRLLTAMARRRGSDAGGSTTTVEQAVAVRRSMAELIGVAWPGLTVGKALYAALQAALLWACLQAVGTAPEATVVFAAFAVERILSLAVVTPGATGIVEVGMTGYLVHAGVDPLTAASGVLLYRLFVIGMEVPVGGALLGWWSVRRVVRHGDRIRRLPSRTVR